MRSSWYFAPAPDACRRLCYRHKSPTLFLKCKRVENFSATVYRGNSAVITFVWTVVLSISKNICQHRNCCLRSACPDAMRLAGGNLETTGQPLVHRSSSSVQTPATTLAALAILSAQMRDCTPIRSCDPDNRESRETGLRKPPCSGCIPFAQRFQERLTRLKLKVK